MNALQKIDEVSLRGTRARKILAEARANVANHASRDARVSDALKIARNNITKFDPKRFPVMLAPVHSERLHREAAAARQARIKRTLDAARAALRRTAPITPPPHITELVHKSTEDARLASEAASPRSRQKEAAPLSADAKESLTSRFEVLHEAVGEAMGIMIADLRTELQRENDCLRREVDVVRRELDLLRHR